MSNSKPIFLKGDNTPINLDGYETTVGELKEHVISSHFYQQKLRELIGGK